MWLEGTSGACLVQNLRQDYLELAFYGEGLTLNFLHPPFRYFYKVKIDAPEPSLCWRFPALSHFPYRLLQSPHHLKWPFVRLFTSHTGEPRSGHWKPLIVPFHPPVPKRCLYFFPQVLWWFTGICKGRKPLSFNKHWLNNGERDCKPPSEMLCLNWSCTFRPLNFNPESELTDHRADLSIPCFKGQQTDTKMHTVPAFQLQLWTSHRVDC